MDFDQIFFFFDIDKVCVRIVTALIGQYITELWPFFGDIRVLFLLDIILCQARIGLLPILFEPHHEKTCL